jgi:hypothetical protein
MTFLQGNGYLYCITSDKELPRHSYGKLAIHVWCSQNTNSNDNDPVKINCELVGE